MKTIRIKLTNNSYNAIIGEKIIDRDEIAESLAGIIGGRRCMTISDTNVAPLFSNTIDNLLVQAGAGALYTATFPAGEYSKTLQTVEQLLHKAATGAALTRKSIIIALGGGVVGDIAGFVAATYMRGIGLIQIPTSLLAMVDSSVGGKVGVDLPSGKNLVGAFHQPQMVIADVSFLTSLSDREFNCGMAEVVKYGVIMDHRFFSYLKENRTAISRRTGSTMVEIVAHCCELKARIVSQDEREGGIRAILNYGHTFGHAIETLTGYTRLNHGEAVAIGMGMAMDLAVLLGQADPADTAAQDALLLSLGLPVRLTETGIGAEKILATMHLDKKAVDSHLRLVLPRSIGAVTVQDKIPLELALKAIGGRCD